MFPRPNMQASSPTVLEFESARSFLDRACLRAAGMAGEWCWAVRDPLRRNYEYAGLSANVHLVAYRHGGFLRVVRFLRGRSRDRLSPTVTATGVLESALVGTVLMQEGAEVAEISTRWAFDGGGHIDYAGPAAIYSSVLSSAVSQMGVLGIRQTSVTSLVALWRPTISVSKSVRPETPRSRPRSIQ